MTNDIFLSKRPSSASREALFKKLVSQISSSNMSFLFIVAGINFFKKEGGLENIAQWPAGPVISSVPTVVGIMSGLGSVSSNRVILSSSEHGIHSFLSGRYKGLIL